MLKQNLHELGALAVLGAGKEVRKEDRFGFIVIQGMADLSGFPNYLVGKALEAEMLDPKWGDTDVTLEQMMGNLDDMVKRMEGEGKQVVIVGISAGAGLGLLYMLSNRNSVRHMFSVSGVINPNLDSGNENDLEMWGGLTKGHPAFLEMVRSLQERLAEPGVVDDLGERVTVYTTAGKDGTVPREALRPTWAKVVEVSSGGHVASIVSALALNIRTKLEEIREASRRGGFE